MEESGARPFAISPSIKRLIIVTTLIGYTALILYLLYVVGIPQLVGVVEQTNLSLYMPSYPKPHGFYILQHHGMASTP